MHIFLRRSGNTLLAQPPSVPALDLHLGIVCVCVCIHVEELGKPLISQCSPFISHSLPLYLCLVLLIC